jgi:hypothetical protein
LKEVIKISDRFDLGDGGALVTCNATKSQRQAIANGAAVSLVSPLGVVYFDRVERYGSVDRTEFLSGPDLKNIGLSFELLKEIKQLPSDAQIRIC